MGHYESALGDAETAIRLDPNHAESHHGRAWILATCPDAKTRNDKAGKPYHRLGLVEAHGFKAPAVAAKSGSRNLE
ncbi:MAG: hypothetical protein ACLQVF_31005 [Isosphaeraceae bacterium]